MQNGCVLLLSWQMWPSGEKVTAGWRLSFQKETSKLLVAHYFNWKYSICIKAYYAVIMAHFKDAVKVGLFIQNTSIYQNED